MPIFIDTTGLYGNTAKTLPAPLPAGITLGGTGILQAGDGTAAAPTFSFANSTGLGLFRKAADSLGFAIGGSEVGRITNTGAWELGTVNGGNPHIFYGVSHTLIGSTGGPAYFRTNQVNNNSGKTWRFGHTGGVGGFTTFDILNETDSITPFSISNTGAVSLGAAIALNYNAPAHVIAGGFSIRTPTNFNSDQAYEFDLCVNANGPNATYLRTSTVNSGVRLALNARTSDTTSCFSVITHGAGTSLGGGGAVILDGISSGAWTLGSPLLSGTNRSRPSIQMLSYDIPTGSSISDFTIIPAGDNSSIMALVSSHAVGRSNIQVLLSVSIRSGVDWHIAVVPLNGCSSNIIVNGNTTSATLNTTDGFQYIFTRIAGGGVVMRQNVAPGVNTNVSVMLFRMGVGQT